MPQQAPQRSRVSASPAAEAVPGDALEAQGDSGQPAAKRPNKSGQQQAGRRDAWVTIFTLLGRSVQNGFCKECCMTLDTSQHTCIRVVTVLATAVQCLGVVCSINFLRHKCIVGTLSLKTFCYSAHLMQVLLYDHACYYSQGHVQPSAGMHVTLCAACGSLNSLWHAR